MSNGNADYQQRQMEESEVLTILKSSVCPVCKTKLKPWSPLKIMWGCENGACWWSMSVSPVTLHKAGL